MEIIAENLCRICTVRNTEMMSIFEHYKFSEDYLQIFKVITKCASVQIQKFDGFSEHICKKCIEHLHQAFSFKRLCEDSDYKFRHNLIVDNTIATQDEIHCIQINEKSVTSDVRSEIQSEFYPEDIMKDPTYVKLNKIKSEVINEAGILHENNIKESLENLNVNLATHLVKTESILLSNPINIEGNDINTRIKCAEVKKEIEDENEKFPVVSVIKSEFCEEDTKIQHDILENQFHGENINSSTQQQSEAGNKPNKCEICLKYFQHRSALLRHIKIHSEEKPYQCEICGKNFRRQSALIDHSKIHTGNKPYKCEICSKNFRFQSALIRHNKTHPGEKPYKCEVCSESFFDGLTLNAHKKIHVGEKSYKCEVCFKEFFNRTTFYLHKRIHTGEKPYKCEVCSKCFSQSSSFIVHKRIHTGQKPFKCETCGKCFRQQGALIDHNLIHTGDKPYECEVCGKTFRHRTVLTTHMTIHTGEKPFKCEICNKCFSHRATFITHKRMHSGEKPYKCETCGKCFNQKDKLNRHNRIHTGEQPYKCEICDKGFRDKTTLTNHETIHIRDAFLQS